MTQKTINIIIIILIVIAIGLGIIALIKSNQRQAPVYPGGPVPPPPGLGGALAGVLAGVLKGDWWKNLLSGKSDYAIENCDPNKKGYNKNGILDPSCGATTGACNPFACDPNRPGYNMCGDAGFPCTCGSETPQTIC